MFQERLKTVASRKVFHNRLTITHTSVRSKPWLMLHRPLTEATESGSLLRPGSLLLFESANQAQQAVEDC